MQNTNETHKMAGISALPLIIILGLIFGAGYLLLQGEIDLDLFEEDRSLEMRRLDDFPTTVGINEELDKQRAIITTEDELVEFLSNVDESGALSVGEKIDFEKEMLVGVSTKNYETGGYGIKIKRIYIDKENQELLVSSIITKPDETCLVTQSPTAAIDIVAIDKTDMKIDFETMTQTEFCEEE